MLVGRGSEGKAPKWRKLKSDLKGKQKEKSANVAKYNWSPSPSPPFTTYILCTNEDAHIAQDPSSSLNFTHFIVDSGASAHMCPEKSYFSSYWKIEPLKHIWVANNHTIEAIGVSDIKVQTFLDGQPHAGIFKEVLHLPTLSESLLSVTKMGNIGLTTILTPKHADIIHTTSGKIVAQVSQDKNLYRLKVEIIRSGHAHITQSQITSKASLALWHWRLGHVSEDTVQRMARSNLTEGMVVDSGRMGDCSACQKGKQTQSPILCTTHDQSSEVLGRVFSDLCGPMETASIGGYQYFITFTNDHSCYMHIRLCKSKDDTLGVFKAWKASAEKEMGKSLKILCTDGGGKYTSSTFNAYLAKHGIKHEVTNVYTPQENGVSEHANWTINNLTHSMMADMKEVLKSKSLPLSLWSQAVWHAMWIKNCIPSWSLNQETKPGDPALVWL